MKRCLNCGNVYDHKSVQDNFCSVACLEFIEQEVFESDDCFAIISKIIDHNEDELPELDTVDKVVSYKDLKAQYGS